MYNQVAKIVYYRTVKLVLTYISKNKASKVEE